MKKLAIIAAAAVLSGCAAGNYQGPTSGGTATITVREVDDNRYWQFNVYKDANCSPHPAGSHFYSSMGMHGAPTQKIAAGQIFVITGDWSKAGVGTVYRCAETVSFVAEEGKSYLATLSTDRDAGRCTVGIEERDPGGNRPVASYRKNDDLCYAGNNEGPRFNGKFR